MNRFLAEALNILNGMVAFLLVVSFALGGHRLLPPTLPDALSLAIGAVVGIVLAAFICGMVAYVALIERHLGEIAKGMRETAGPMQARPAPTHTRQEPQM